MAHVVNAELVAFVRLADGGKVRLDAGQHVPANADADHVASLTEAGVLTEVKEPKGRSGGSGSGEPGKN